MASIFQWDFSGKLVGQLLSQEIVFISPYKSCQKDVLDYPAPFWSKQELKSNLL